MKIIIFDLAEVIINGLIGVQFVIAKKVNSDPDTVNNILLNEAMQELFLGQITEDEYLSNIINKYNWQLSLTELKKIIRDNFKPVPGTKELILKMRNRNPDLKIVLLSVHAVEWIKDCKALFHEIFFLLMTVKGISMQLLRLVLILSSLQMLSN